jgi:hypothetical protein
MADFRKWILVVLAVLALFMIPTHALAQSSVSCQAISVSPQLRGEGLTELVGDITLQCSGTPSAGQVANITVYLNQTVTSKILTGSATVAGQLPSEALLLINKPEAGNQNVCTSYTVGANQSVTGNCAYTSNVFQGVVLGSSVTFYGVPILPPATGQTATNYDITNIRINANLLSGGGSIPNPAQAAIAITSQSSIPVNNSLVTVGYITSSLKTAVNQAAPSYTTAAAATDLTGQQCVGVTKLATETLAFSELQGSAFKYRGTTAQTDLNQFYFTESGLTIPIGSQTAGYADWGTRLKAVFSNIPSGVTIYVSTTNRTAAGLTTALGILGSTEYAQLIGSETATYTTSGVPAVGTPGTLVPLTNVNGTAEAVWEVENAISSETEGFYFDVAISYASNAVASTVAPGMTVNLAYAPTYTSTVGGVASSTLGIPRFADTSTATNALNISICQTALLYPYVVNVAGYDTGLAIANTTSDPFGTSPQSGYCTINWYGAAAPAAGYLGSAGYQATAPTATTGFVQTGTVQAWSASVNAPGFDGYVIAVCNFQYAHGFAFISDLGGRNLAMGYLADVINGNFGTSRVAAPKASESNGQ